MEIWVQDEKEYNFSEYYRIVIYILNGWQEFQIIVLREKNRDGISSCKDLSWAFLQSAEDLVIYIHQLHSFVVSDYLCLEENFTRISGDIPSETLPVFCLHFWNLCCSVVNLCPALCDPVDCSMPGFPILHHLPELAQTHVFWVGDAIQLSHSLLSPSPPAFNLSKHQGLFKWVSSSHQVAKVLGLQLQHQSF